MNDTLHVDYRLYVGVKRTFSGIEAGKNAVLGEIMQQTLLIINVLLHMAYEIFIDWSRGWETEMAYLWQSNQIGNASLFHKGR